MLLGFDIIVSPPITFCPTETSKLYLKGKYRSTLLPNLIIPNRLPLITSWLFFKSQTILLAIKPAICETITLSLLSLSIKIIFLSLSSLDLSVLALKNLPGI